MEKGTREHPRVVGREAELAALDEFLVGGGGGGGGLVLTGGAGIGKTTLWEAAVGAARECGMRVLVARPSETETQLALASLADLLVGVDDEIFGRLPAPQAQALDIALLRAAPSGRPPPPRAVAAAFLGLLRELGRSGAVLVAVDDVQWLDPPSADALAFAARRLDDDNVSFLVTHRAGTSSPLIRALDAGSPSRVSVEGLSLGAIRRLLSEQLRLILPRRALRQLVDATGGNPLFALEIGRVFAERGVPAAGEPLPVPHDVQALVSERISQLPQQTRELLLAAALLARPATETLRRAVAGSLEAHLEPAERAAIARLERGILGFVHPIHAACVVASATTAERLRMHRRLAATAPGREERARHLALAVESRDEAAATEIDAAARDAFLRGASSAAAELAELALDVGDPESDARPARLFAVASYLQWAGEPGRARGVLEAVDDWTTWPARLRARAQGQLLTAVYWTEGAVAATELGERLLEESPPDEVSAEIHAFLSGSHEVDFERAVLHGNAALALLERFGDDADPAALARALTFHVRNRLVLGLGFERDLFDRVVELEEQLANEGWPGERVSSNFANWFKHFDDLETSRSMLEQRLEEAEAVNDEFTQIAALMHLGLTECWTGRLEVARDHLVAAGRIVDELGARNVGIIGMTALVEAHLGNADAVRALAARAVEEHGELTGRESYETYLGAGLGLLALSLGDAEEADRRLTVVLRGLEAGAIREPGIFRVHANAAEAAVGIGDLERAEQIADVLADHAERTGHRWSRAASERVRALVCAARADLEAALAHADDALAAHEHVPMPFERARTLLVKGVIERRLRRRARARSAFEEAASEFERMGARLWAERARRESTRVAGRPPQPENELTPTEQRVVDLAASGLSNKEIAATLFVTVHTVEVHLSHAYAKLGVRSRTQLARVLDARP